MTIDDVIKENPWMEEFRGEMKETCHDCGVSLGEQHKEGCDTARCTSCDQQRLACDCTDGEPSKWLGVMYDDLHFKCIKYNLWCRDAILEEDGSLTYATSPEIYRRLMEINFATNYKGVKWHIPCERNDPGAHPDLNRATTLTKNNFGTRYEK